MTIQYLEPHHIKSCADLLEQISIQHTQLAPDTYQVPSNEYNRTILEGYLVDNKEKIGLVYIENTSVIGLLLASLIISNENGPVKDVISTKIDVIVVSNLHQRKGIGTLLLHQIESLAKENNSVSITLGVNTHNVAAQGFYNSLGYASSNITMRKNI